MPSFRASATNSGTTPTTGTINKPTGTAQGDLLVLQATAYDDVSPTPGISAPDGSWTVLYDEAVGTALGGFERCSAWYKIAGGSEPASYDITLSSQQDWRATISAWQGVSQVSPFNAQAISVVNSGSGDLGTAPSVTPTIDNTLIYFHVNHDTSSPDTAPSGYTERYDDGVGATVYGGQYGADKAMGTAAATGTAVGTGGEGADRHVAAHFILQAAYEQEGFRFRNDDGSETGASWRQSQDVDDSIAVNTSFRLRVLLNRTG